MDLLRKYFKNDTFFSLGSDYSSYYFQYINEKPVSSCLAPMTLILLCYYTFIYVRKFYPIYVNCWFCNANFKVPFEDRFEYSCIECGQFNGFKKDGSYTKIIPEQHNERFNRKSFTVIQNNLHESKNGLCHKCNIFQEIKVKQLASFVPIKEKNFDIEIEMFKKQLEKSLQLCSKCKQYTKKLLLVQEQRYNLKSILTNGGMDKQNVSNLPNICSVCLSIAVFVLSTGDYLDNFMAKFVDISIFTKSFVTVTQSIGMASLFGALCQAYQCLQTMNKLNAVIMLLWSSLFAINNFEVLDNLQPKIVISIIIIFLSAMLVLNNLTKKPILRQSSIQLEDENYKMPCDISTNGSIKNSHKSEMMDIDCAEESPYRGEKLMNNTVNSLFEGLKINDNQRNFKSKIIRPQKFIVKPKRDKTFGYAEPSYGYYSPYSSKEDYDFDTHSIYSQQSYRSQCLSLCPQTILPYDTYYSHPHHHYQPNLLNLSHSSNSSNFQQQSSEWQKMVMYSIPGIILLALQCYLLYDIKDFMKRK